MLLKGLGVLGIGLISILLHGWVLMKLWGWFISPATGLNEITIMIGMGIFITFKLLMGMDAYAMDSNIKDVDKDNVMDIFKMILNGIGYPLIALAFGWIIQFNI